MKIKLSLLMCAALILAVGCGKSVEHKIEETVSVEKQSSASKVSSGITIDLYAVKQKIENYKISHPGVTGEEYALRSWVSLDDLKEYIAHIENVSREKGIEVSGIDIIHVQNIATTSGKPNLNNQDYDLTVLLAPTYEQNTSHIAFDPIYSEKGAPKTLEELLDSTDLSNRAQKPRPSSVANHVTSCPSNCL